MELSPGEMAGLVGAGVGLVSPALGYLVKQLQKNQEDKLEALRNKDRVIAEKDALIVKLFGERLQDERAHSRQLTSSLTESLATTNQAMETLTQFSRRRSNSEPPTPGDENSSKP